MYRDMIIISKAQLYLLHNFLITMLQRIQSLYLLAAGLVLAALFVFPLVHDVSVHGNILTLMVTGVYQDINGTLTHTVSFMPLTIATVFVALSPLPVIFLYKDRRKQINLCYGLMFLIIAYSYWVSQTVKDAIADAYLKIPDNYGIGIILLSLSLLLIVLAQKSIQRDEKLVKSADRLR
jgi:predicted branched-subunit amino acid permease